MRGTRPAKRALVVLTLAACALVGSTGGVAHAATPAQTAAQTAAQTPAGTRTVETTTDTPLTVTLTRLSPSTIPARGVITMDGILENSSTEDWTDINLAPFVSGTPITTRDDLAEAAASPADAAVGERLTDPNLQVSVGDLAPGMRTSFTVKVPVASLPITGAPGVYWIGVHALGATSAGRDLLSDGRARTFIPLVPKDVARRRTVPLSVVLPLRERARRAADGSLNGPARWVSLTRPQGRLGRLADFGSSAGAAPITWLIDPAVLDALQDFGRGNPPLSLGSDRPSNATGGNQSPDTSPAPSPTPAPLSGAPSKAEQLRAASVLDTILSTVRSGTALNLGYADPDVAALARRGPRLLRRAEDLSGRSMKAHNLSGSPVVAPPDGYFDPSLLGRLPRTTLVMLGDHELLGEPRLSRLPTGQDLVLTDDRAASGGPAPDPATAPLALRQRILAEAALEATAGSEAVRPMVFAFPAGWNPGAYWRDADFFGGLEVPWLRLAPVPRGASTSHQAELTYGRAQRAAEVRPSNLSATRSLVRTSTVLGHLLANQNDVVDRLTGAALQASSYGALRSPGLAASQVLALDGTMHSQLSRVEVTGTDFVTLSGGSGSLTVTLVNGLRQPITVGLKARTDSPGVTVQTPDPVSMQAGQRTTLRLQVKSRVGVHEVTLSPVTTQGENAGTPLTFSLRTSQVGRLIWYIIIAGGVLLAVMIVRRIVLRIRLNRWRVRQQ